MLEVKNLKKRFGDNQALDGVSLKVGQGELFGFVGANGAGKTTTMRIIMGLLSKDDGEVLWRGNPMKRQDRVRATFMPEERGLYPKMRIGAQIAYFGELHGQTRAEAKHAASKWLERLNLADREKDYVQDLSLGNQQRVQLAVSLVHEPDLLILDEPFSGLDPIAVDTMGEVLAERAKAGVPVIFSSHQLELVEKLCDQVGIISAGKMVASGSVAELRRQGTSKLRVIIDGADPNWVSQLGVTSTSVANNEWVIDSQDDQRILKAAMAAGRVVKFGFDEPSLVDIFREAAT
ncbi:MAG TPA: ATP-binding cassette domain-containing protein [Candidatus Stackebrandtia faecavium]|nr:ATP-binding cassette domain-containing protein [Candidatus Stackebrandtia faecavium]